MWRLLYWRQDAKRHLSDSPERLIMSRRSLRRTAPSGLAALAMTLGLAAYGGNATPAIQKAASATTVIPCATPTPTTPRPWAGSPTATRTASASPPDTSSALPCPTTTRPTSGRTTITRSPSPSPSGVPAQPGVVPGPAGTEGAKNLHVTEPTVPVSGNAFRSGRFDRGGTTVAKLHEIHIEQLEDGGQTFIRVAWFFRDALPGSHVEYTDRITGPDGQPVQTAGDTQLNVHFQPATGRIAEPSPGQPVNGFPVLQSLHQYEEANNFLGFALGVQSDANGGPRPLRVGDFEQPNNQFGTLFVSFVDLTA